MATNMYTINGGAPQLIEAGVVDIDMSTETDVKAGCDRYPIPLLNKITVRSEEGELSKSTTIYAGYKIVNQMLGALVVTGNYNPGTPLLSTIITSGRFGIFEPAHYDYATGRWSVYDLRPDQIGSLINIGTGIKICVKIDYTNNNSSPATVYVDIPVAYNRFTKTSDTNVPLYSAIGTSNLTVAESVSAQYVDNADRRTWFESILTADSLNVNLSSSIVDPDTTEDITITLMAYIGSIPTENNTFKIQPMTSGSTTSATVQFETYEPTITIANKDAINNPDTYTDGYGSVAEYSTLTDNDTTISISIVAP